MREAIGKIAASSCIIFLSGVVLYQSCLRASTIYFFELDNTTVVFIERIPALLFPLGLSTLLWLVYKGTKRSAELENERRMLIEKETELRDASAPVSRKVSRTEDSRKTSFSTTDDHAAEQARKIKRLLSDIEEQDTIHSYSNDSMCRKILPSESEHDSEDTPKDSSPVDSPHVIKSRFTLEKVEEPKIIIPENDDAVRSRAGSTSTRSLLRSKSTSEDEYLRKISGLASYNPNVILVTEDSMGISRKSSIDASAGRISRAADEPEDDTDQTCDIYKQFGEIDLFTYTLSALNLLPSSDHGPHIVIKLNISDIIAEFFAVHVPVWACIAALHVVILEMINVHFAYYFYYHEETMVYSALAFSILFGLLHEYSGNWITNDILAFSSIYIISSRFQAVSYQTAVVFVIGMALFDLFWIYAIDLLSTVTRESRAPLMIMIPRDKDGHKQSLATLDIMVPGIFLNVVLKYSSMYDTGLFMLTFCAVFASLVLTMLFAIWRHKITPAMVLPAVVAIGVTMACATHPQDLWRFMIKH